MIQITIFKNQNQYQEVKCVGHAGYARHGKDIVCASVSILVINTINSIDTFTEDAYRLDTDEKSGLIDFVFTEDISEKSILLLNSLVLGLTEIQKQYSKYVTLNIEEV